MKTMPCAFPTLSPSPITARVFGYHRKCRSRRRFVLFNSNSKSSSLVADSVSADETESIEADNRARVMCFQMRFSNDSYIKTVTNKVRSQLVQCVHLCD